eukprot:Sspe_Gene.102640::Locus_78509_Transcript_1_1_Confidence_1.000_Length_651::g.102640::m.102640
MLRLPKVVKPVLRSATAIQVRCYRDGKKGILRSHHKWLTPQGHGGVDHSSHKWMVTGKGNPRDPRSYAFIPLSVQTYRPYLDPYVFKYVGVKVGPDGKPIMDTRRRHRETQIRHEFRSLLAERNYHGFPLLYPTRPRPHPVQWVSTRKTFGIFR